MKTKEELDAIKSELENLSAKMKELDEDELKEVIGGEDYGSLSKNPHDPTILTKFVTTMPIASSCISILLGSSNKSTDPEKYEKE